MTISDTRFGAITIDGETFDHDVVVRLSCRTYMMHW